MSNSPIDQAREWLAAEEAAGNPFVRSMVVATADENGRPSNRVVALRELDERGALFFTQTGTGKVVQLKRGFACATFWLPQTKRQVILDGNVEELTPEENQHYWAAKDRQFQIEFSAYAPISGEPIDAIEDLEKRAEPFQTMDTIPCPPEYVGFRIKPERIVFYTLKRGAFSEVERYSHFDGSHLGGWTGTLVAP